MDQRFSNCLRDSRLGRLNFEEKKKKEKRREGDVSRIRILFLDREIPSFCISFYRDFEDGFLDGFKHWIREDWIGSSGSENGSERER